MVNSLYVEFLAYKIINKEINPKTNKEFCLDDIRIEEYLESVEALINEINNKENDNE